MRVQVQKEFTPKGQQQPKRKGETIDLPDNEAREQIQQGNVVEVDEQRDK
jgi:hypothetical protein